jgi:hypothetical protein
METTNMINPKHIFISILAVLFVFPLMGAFAQPSSNDTKQGTGSTEAVTVTGTIIKMTTEDGSATNYQPVKTLVIREDRSNTPGSYVLNGPGHVLNKNGEVIRTAIKPGAHVRIYYAQAGDSRIVDHVVVD